MKVRPLQDRVLVTRKEEEKKTAGGIIIPDNNTEKPAEGTVVAVGPGSSLSDGSVRPLGLKPGDSVLFGKYAGNEVEVGGDNYIIMREDDILGVLEA